MEVIVKVVVVRAQVKPLMILPEDIIWKVSLPEVPAYLTILLYGVPPPPPPPEIVNVALGVDPPTVPPVTVI